MLSGLPILSLLIWLPVLAAIAVLFVKEQRANVGAILH